MKKIFLRSQSWRKAEKSFTPFLHNFPTDRSFILDGYSAQLVFYTDYYRKVNDWSSASKELAYLQFYTCFSHLCNVHSNCNLVPVCGAFPVLLFTINAKCDVEFLFFCYFYLYSPIVFVFKPCLSLPLPLINVISPPL